MCPYQRCHVRVAPCLAPWLSWWPWPHLSNFHSPCSTLCIMGCIMGQYHSRVPHCSPTLHCRSFHLQRGGEGRSVENAKNAFPFGLWWHRALFGPVGAPPPPVPGRGAFVSYAMLRRCSVDVPLFRRCSVDAPVTVAFPAAPAAPRGAPGLPMTPGHIPASARRPFLAPWALRWRLVLTFLIAMGLTSRDISCKIV